VTKKGGELSLAIAKALIFIGLSFITIGCVIFAFQHFGLSLPLGQLPGDITYRGKFGTIYLPLTSCLIISILLSSMAYLIRYFKS